MGEKAIRRILVGLDGSKGSAAALDWAITWAKDADAEIVAVHVFQLSYPLTAPPAGGTMLGLGSEVASAEELLRQGVKEAFRTEWTAPLAQAGVRYRELFGEGRAGPVLIEAAEREEADVIVTGRRGLGSLTEIVAGSVSQYLVHRSGRPVLVIPNPLREDTDG
jgi:nucleotide-binding universal stress UspA family protein